MNSFLYAVSLSRHDQSHPRLQGMAVWEWDALICVYKDPNEQG